MKRTTINIILALLVLSLQSHGQGESWAVYALIHSRDEVSIDPCEIKYCVLEEEDGQSAEDLTSSTFKVIYENLDYETAIRLRDLHSPQGANLPDQVVKFSPCTLTDSDPPGKNNLFRTALHQAKKEFEKKGMLYFVGQGASALASSGLIKDDKTNEILKTMGRIKVKIPINLSKNKSRETL